MLVIIYGGKSDVKWGMLEDAIWLTWGEIREKKESSGEPYGAKWLWPMEPEDRYFQESESNRLLIK